MKNLSIAFLLIAVSLDLCATEKNQACISLLQKNNIPYSKAKLDCQKYPALVITEKVGEREVEKEIPIPGAERPSWMTRDQFQRAKSNCYDNSKEAYERACESGYSIGKEGECRLPTYVNGKRIRQKSTPTYTNVEDCYKKKGIYGIRGTRTEKVMEPVYKKTRISYEDLLKGKDFNVPEASKSLIKNTRECLKVVEDTPLNTVGMRRNEINYAPRGNRANHVFSICNSDAAPIIANNKDCYNEINKNPDKYPITSNLEWWRYTKKNFCEKLMRLKDTKGFINCKKEVTTHSYPRDHIQKGLMNYLSLDGGYPRRPEINSCLNYANLKWFESDENIKKAQKCVRNILSSVSANANSEEISAGLKNCYGSNLSNICSAYSSMSNRGSWDFDLCNDNQLTTYKNYTTKSCSGDRPKDVACKINCLKFALSKVDRKEAIDLCKDKFYKFGSENFQNCFYQVNDQHGGPLNIEKTLSFCPASKTQIAEKLGESRSILDSVFEAIYQ